MKFKLLFATATAIAALQSAQSAETKRVEHKETVICTSRDGGAVTCSTSTDGGAPVVVEGGSQRVIVETEDVHGEPGDDVNVQVTRSPDGQEKRVVVVRRGFDDADANKDGRITKKEFVARAEKRFGELDTNHDGVLSQDEARPPMPPLAPLPPLPPLPPVGAVPPVAPPPPPPPPPPPGN